MTLEEWCEHYKPIDNLSSERFGFSVGDRDQIVHACRGVDMSAISNSDPKTIWTLLDCDGIPIVTNGYHRVNREGYLITQKPFSGDDIEIYFDEDDRPRD